MSLNESRKTEPAGHELSSAFAHTLPLNFILKKKADLVRQTLHITRLQHESSFIWQ